MFRSSTETSYPRPGRRIFLSSMTGILVLVFSMHPGEAQTTSPPESLQKAILFYQVYAVADACMKAELSFSSDDMDTITTTIEGRITALNLTDDERTKVWSAVLQAMQIVPIDPQYCLETRQWFAFSLPEVFSGRAEDKPF